MSYWFSSYLAALERSLNAYVYVVVNSLPPFYVHCPECYSVISLSLGVLFPSEKLLVYVVDVVVYPSRLLFVHFPRTYSGSH